MNNLKAPEVSIIDTDIDKEICAYLSLEKPTSFFLFAGAGSGKTGSLVTALMFLRNKYGRQLFLKAQKIGVITYTNAACDEIKKRLDFDSLFEISTIHSFVWSLIEGFNVDIKRWLLINLRSEIAEIQALEIRGRAGTKASIDRANNIISKEKRIEKLKDVRRFNYSPNGENSGYDSLNHSEVIKIASDFLLTKTLMKQLLWSKFPILLIDESQDTNKNLMEAFLKVEAEYTDKFLLGLFGDTMQRIYADGKIDLGQNLPANWAKPTKRINHRCPKRVITLINKIRLSVDKQSQIPGINNEEGFVRIFVLPNSTSNRQIVEDGIAKQMAAITADPKWNDPKTQVKTLILEHHMAAKRLGFFEMYEPLYKIEKFRTGLLDGTLSSIRIFSKLILPVITAKKAGNEFKLANILRSNSPLLSRTAFKAAAGNQENQLKKTQAAISSLIEAYSKKDNPTFIDLLNSVAESGLFEIPISLHPIINRTIKQREIVKQEAELQKSDSTEADNDHEIDALDKFLSSEFSQLTSYVEYIEDKSNFDTHQGIKGRQFPRVMVIIDDSEAKGFLFSYEKLFGAKAKTKTDLEHEKNGEETSLDRTRRLLYVTCSRTMTSLAIVAYSEFPAQVQKNVISEGWFSEDEVIIVNG